MPLLSLLFNVVSFELLDYIIFYLIIILQGVGWLLMISVLCSGVLCFIRFVNSRTPSVFNIILFTLLAFYLLLLLISDHASIINITNESAYTICSPLEHENVGRALKVGGSMALVVWGTIGTLGTSFNQRWSAAERSSWTMGNVPSYLRDVIVGLILSDGGLRIYPCGVNARLEFNQSMSHFPYFYSVFGICAPLCQSMFKFGTRFRGKPSWLNAKTLSDGNAFS